MQTHRIKKLLEEHPDGIDVAVVTGHTVQMQYRANVVDTLQTATRVRLTRIDPEGQPREDTSWRTAQEYKRRTLVGVLQEDTYQYDPISGKKGETVYFEPRRVLNTWAERKHEQAEDAAMRQRWEREKAEKLTADQAMSARLAKAQRKLGLVLRSKPVIRYDVHNDGSVSFGLSVLQHGADDLAALLEDLAERISA